MMEQRIEKPELVARVAARVQKDAGPVEEILDATLEEIYQALKRGESVSLRNFGTFYVREERSKLGLPVQSVAEMAGAIWLVVYVQG